ncbi:MAG: hypothetical protein GC136_02600 [Alphaproteobacteria bacterium]|nr:hypothetical protein [Alphaproteobacteria bacterium]
MSDMDNEPQDLEPEDLDFDTDLGNSNGGQSLKELVKQPMVKLGLVAGGFVLLIILISTFGGSKKEAPSVVANAPDIKEAPGTQELSPAVAEAVESFNQQKLEEAIKTGQSYVPVPTDPIKDRLPDSGGMDDTTDPLAKWREMQRERKERETVQRQQAMTQLQVPQKPTKDDAAEKEALKAMAQSMSNHMNRILGDQSKDKMQFFEVPNAVAVATGMQQQQAGLGNLLGSNTANATLANNNAALTPEQQAALMQEQKKKTLVPAGKIEYAQLITEANTDAPGPVLAEIVSGPLRGSRLLGSFRDTNDYLTLSFNTVVYKKESIPIEAVAVNPDNALPGLVSEIDRKYWSRVILPAAARFIEGMGEAIAESGSTTVTVDGGAAVSSQNDLDAKQELYKGVEKAAEELGNIFEENRTERPTIVVYSGTPMGIIFMRPVVEGQTYDAMYAQQQGQGGFSPYGNLTSNWNGMGGGIPGFGTNSSYQPYGSSGFGNTPLTGYSAQLGAPAGSTGSLGYYPSYGTGYGNSYNPYSSYQPTSTPTTTGTGSTTTTGTSK